VTIKGYTEMLLSGELGLTTDTQRRSLRVVLKNVGRLMELIDQILQFRRLASAPLPRQLRPFALRQILADIEQNFQPQIREGRFDFAIELPNCRVMVVADRPRIERVFTNLVSNALKFTSSGGRIRVRVSEPRNGYVDAAVEDTGCGIPKEAQKYIFDRYRQSDGSVRRRFGGTGLGLAIVKRILQAHGVQITVESEVNKGSVFRFRLPVAMEAIKSSDVPSTAEGSRR
jgi:signal transduction histidine kinase